KAKATTSARGDRLSGRSGGFGSDAIHGPSSAWAVSAGPTRILRTLAGIRCIAMIGLRKSTNGPSPRSRLLMIVHGPYPVGEPRVAREVAVALAEGFDVDVLATRRSGEPARELEHGAEV